MSGSAANLQLGIGDLGLKVYSAGSYASGFTSPGWHSEKGVVATYKQDEKKHKVGNSQGVVKIFITGEELALEGEVEDFTAANVASALGLASSDITDDEVNHIKSMFIGGNVVANYVSAQFTHVFDITGLFARITLFKARFSGGLKLEWKPGDPTGVPMKMEAMIDDAVGATNGKLGLIEFKYQV